MSEFSKPHQGEIPILCGLILVATLVITQIDPRSSDVGPNPTQDVVAMEASFPTDPLDSPLMSDLIISDNRIH
ncbi:MAG: hypothetical protein ACYTF7_09330 [Planctomycetota bacterium]|jgi:hypothetical protein